MSTNSAPEGQSSGATLVKGSRRPDGTYRKDVRVREGYVPQEEVPVYESKGKKYVKAVEAMGVVGATFVEDAPAKHKKTPKKKEPSTAKVTKKLEGFTIEEPEAPKRPSQNDTAASNATASPEDADKKIKNLKKKLKQIDEIQQRAATGEILNADQQEKLSKRAELEKELKQMEALLKK